MHQRIAKKLSHIISYTLNSTHSQDQFLLTSFIVVVTYVLQ